MTKFKQYGFWAILGLTAFGFFAAGSAKLMGVPEVHKSFAVLGLPAAFGYFIGVCEISGAIGLLIKKLSALAAAGLAMIMIGAMYYHIQYDPAHFMAAALLFVFAIIIFVVRKKDSAFLLKTKRK